MLDLIPPRIIPGFLFALMFVAAGLGAGFAAGTLCLEPSKLRVFPATFVLWFPLACWYVRGVWREGSDGDLVNRVTALSPRLMAVLLGACLVAGLACGGLIAYATSQAA